MLVILCSCRRSSKNKIVWPSKGRSPSSLLSIHPSLFLVAYSCTLKKAVRVTSTASRFVNSHCDLLQTNCASNCMKRAVYFTVVA